MAFVRMILPAWIAGGYASLSIVLLIYFLNPALHLTLSTSGRFLPFVLLLSLSLGLVWPLLYRFLRLFARRRLRVRWYSFRYVFGFATADLILVAGLYWYNSNLLRALLPPGMSFRLKAACIVLTGVALTFLVVLSLARLRRERGVQIACYVLAGMLPLSLAAIRTGYRAPTESPYTSELPRPTAQVPRLLVLGIGGATLDQVVPLVAQGKLPWISRLFNQGAYGRLDSFRPCLSPVVWQSLLTGMSPHKHLILGAIRYRLPSGAGEIRVAPRGVGFGTLARLSGFREMEPPVDQSPSLTFIEILERLEYPIRWLGDSEDLPRASPPLSLERFFPRSTGSPSPGREELEDALNWAMEQDQTIVQAGLRAWRESEDRGVVIRLPGLDRVSHYFLKFAEPEGFGNVPAAEVERYGKVLERYYRYLDEVLGEFLQQGAESPEEDPDLTETVVVLVSPHGIEPLPLARRFLEALRGNRYESGYHNKAPDGMILAAGPGIRRGATVGEASIQDVAPTFLYLFGLPIGVDMDGHPATSLFDEAFIAAHPVLLIPSYQASRIGSGEPP